MKRIAAVICVLAVVGLVLPAIAQDKPTDKPPVKPEVKPPVKTEKKVECTCDAIKKAGTGWCEHCAKGLYMGSEVKVEKVYKTLVGEPAPKEFKCKDCEAAAKKDGWCEKDKVGFAGGKMYASKFAWDLAKGQKVDAATVKCEDCKKLIADKKDGYCPKCEGGLVSGLFFKGKEAYDQAAAAAKLVKESVGAKCEGCAFAMLTDGKCEKCKAEYKDGKKKGA